jgi:spermidine synthase
MPICVIILDMMEEGFHFRERFAGNLVRSIKVDKIYYEGRTKHQLVQIFKNRVLGKVLFLDKKIQSAQIDECVYHESLVHPAMLTHPNPERVLVIGGGEGATLREVLRHDCVRKATMVDIDKELVELCREYLPEWSDGAWTDPRSEMIFRDAIRYTEGTTKKFEIVISDLTEPIEGGPSVLLFSLEFFEKVSRILREDGLFVLQAGSTDRFDHRFYVSCARTLERIFPIVRPYRTFMFSFGCPWGFILASHKHDPLQMEEADLKERIKNRKIRGLKYYHSGFHRAFFGLPAYLVNNLKRGRILTRKKPFIWES